MSLISRIKSFFNRKKEAQKAEAMRVLETPIRPAPLEQKPALLTPRMPGRSITTSEVVVQRIKDVRARLDEAPVPGPYPDPMAAFYSPFMLASLADLNRETYGSGATDTGRFSASSANESAQPSSSSESYSVSSSDSSNSYDSSSSSSSSSSSFD